MIKPDIIICALPPLFVDRLPGAPAIIKSVVQQAGYTARAIDMSLDFFIHECNRNLHTFDQLGGIFRPLEQTTQEQTTAVHNWLARNIEILRQSQTQVIGISVFTAFQHRATWLLCKEIRKHLPSVKIVLGGLGLNIAGSGLVGLENLPKTDIISPFHILLKKRNLADYVILGVDTFDAIIDTLDEIYNQKNSNRKNHHTTGTIYSSPIPDYTDYLIDEYCWTDGKALPITGSKGCVRNCTFCDVPGQFGRFRMRTGNDIAEEMIYLAERHNIRKFEFTDSLVNGSLKGFRDWLIKVADYNDRQESNNKISWFGQYICRPQSQIPKDIYDLMYRSGVTNLVIGVESGSNEILAAMKKQMTIQNVYDELDMLQKHKIKSHLLLFSGFYNENQKRFNETLEFLINCQKYVASKTISRFTISTPLFINNDMYLYNHAEELGITLDPYNTWNWTTKHDPKYNLIQRFKNRLVQEEFLNLLGFPSSEQATTIIQQIHEMLKSKETELQNTLAQL